MQKYNYAAFKNLILDRENENIVVKSYWHTMDEAYRIAINSIDLIIYVEPTFLKRGFLMIKFVKTNAEIALLKKKKSKKPEPELSRKLAKQKRVLSIQRKISYGFGEHIENLINDLKKIDSAKKISVRVFPNLKEMRQVFHKKSN